MKRTGRLLSVLLTVVLMISMIPATIVLGAGGDIRLSNFEDRYFGQYCLDTFGNGTVITAAQASAVKEISSASIGYSSVRGIENFPNLEILRVNGNSITSLDISQNTKLKTVIAQNNGMTSITIGNNTSLEVLQVNTNHLSYVDVSRCPNLRSLRVNHNSNISSLNLTNCTKLERLFCQNNNISSLDISHCPLLVEIICSVNPLSTLDVRNCPSMVDTMTYGGKSNYNSGDFYSCTTGTLTVPYGCNVIYTGGSPVPTTNPTSNPTSNPTANPTVRPTANPTNAPVTRPSSSPVTNPTSNPTVVPSGNGGSSESGVGGFVERLYTIALDRPSDANGKADWVNRVYTQGATGADIASGFLFSPEFLGKNMSNDAFVDVLYRVFFDRAGDTAGKSDWVNRMANGWSKQDVIWGFINSTEWANVCLRFGIASGGNGVANITIEPSAEIIAFATRLYTTCLGRQADNAGLMDWARRLANRQISGSDAAAGFFTSTEFLNGGYDNAEYINRLYQTFMGRPADQGGFDYWMSQFANGASRQDVFNGFAGSQEWAGICSSYGILK